jgi:hypothetical protein
MASISNLLRELVLERDCRLCCNCDRPATVVHHIVPRALGGSDGIRNLASLCDECHGKVHDTDFVKRRRLSEASIAHRKATGGDLGGRRRSYTDEQAEMVRELREAGDSLRTIGKKLGLSLGTVQRVLEVA